MTATVSGASSVSESTAQPHCHMHKWGAKMLEHSEWRQSQHASNASYPFCLHWEQQNPRRQKTSGQFRRQYCRVLSCQQHQQNDKMFSCCCCCCCCRCQQVECNIPSVITDTKAAMFARTCHVRFGTAKAINLALGHEDLQFVRVSAYCINFCDCFITHLKCISRSQNKNRCQKNQMICSTTEYQ